MHLRPSTGLYPTLNCFVYFLNIFVPHPGWTRAT